MCMICRHIPCDSRCPNSTDKREAVTICRFCKAILYKGDRYLSAPKGCICEECLNAFTMWEWLEAFNKELEEV